MRILGLDVGSRTIGVACSDALLITAQGIETIRRESKAKDFGRLQEIVKEKEVHRIVVGKPRHMNGDNSVNIDKIEHFVAELKKVMPSMEFVYWDERLTTVMAQRQLIEAHVRREKRKQVVDKMAAVFILQNYLDAQGG
ncbi:Holliday junction resolvase RuvX [Megasphaera paucivorans]|jgi:putative holliday junction resolvase|uniref:Putative pre-16S rRNA nuclease n=1 Tax=Megasphaera paucivorans TaxID=349095 RepID=A0A1G9Y0T9_9FIRM|nr:Holliday junction resolvase RuvX [Megasphaera paucivorans]SDN02678.1 putative holliday junction resolvase [Megasphaera paucivorans]